MPIDLYSFLLFLHALCFVYWLGGDLGVFYSSGILIKPGLSAESRRYVLKVMHWLDQFPRVCMPLVIALGFTMGSMRWFELSSYWLILIWMLTAIWIYFVIALFLNKQNKNILSVIRKIDMAMRWIIAIAVTLIAIESFRGQSVGELKIEDGWLSAKLLIWACTVYCGIASRYTMRPFSDAFARIMEKGDNPEDLDILKRSLYTTRIPILGIWVLVAMAGAAGIWKI